MKFRVDRVVPSRDELALSEEEVRAALEIMAIAIAADGRVDEDERECFVAAAIRLDALVGDLAPADVGPYRTAAKLEEAARVAMTSAEARRLLDELLSLARGDALADRGERLAAALTRTTPRELAFRLAVAAAVADLSIEPAEEGLIAELRALLAIDRARAAELMAATYAALGARG